MQPRRFPEPNPNSRIQPRIASHSRIRPRNDEHLLEPALCDPLLNRVEVMRSSGANDGRTGKNDRE